MSRRIDLNCDVGEIPERIADGSEDALMDHVTSVNIACGGHAGDEATMEATIRSALARGIAVGAHPGYPDRGQFGRRVLAISPDEVAATVGDQVRRLAAVAARLGATIRHVKPHGALYNAAARDRDLAEAIARAAGSLGAGVVLVGLAGAPVLEVWRAAGFRVAAEAFADRRYEPDGTLRQRTLRDALLTDPEEAAAQAVSIARDGEAVASDGSRVAIRADTLCLHGDTPGAASIAAAVAAALRAAGVTIAALDRVALDRTAFSRRAAGPGPAARRLRGPHRRRRHR